MVEEILVPITFFAAAFGIVYVAVTAKNRERLAMIEKGLNPNEGKPAKTNTQSLLKWAMLIIGLGVGFFVGSLLDTYTNLPDESGYFSSVLLFGGLGLLIAFLVTRKSKE